MSRSMVATLKIDKKITGLAAAIYLHVDRDNEGHVIGLSISQPGKFANSTLSDLFDQINGAIAHELNPNEPEPGEPAWQDGAGRLDV